MYVPETEACWEAVNFLGEPVYYWIIHQFSRMPKQYTVVILNRGVAKLNKGSLKSSHIKGYSSQNCLQVTVANELAIKPQINKKDIDD